MLQENPPSFSETSAMIVVMGHDFHDSLFLFLDETESTPRIQNGRQQKPKGDRPGLAVPVLLCFRASSLARLSCYSTRCFELASLSFPSKTGASVFQVRLLWVSLGFSSKTIVCESRFSKQDCRYCDLLALIYRQAVLRLVRFRRRRKFQDL